MNSPTGKGISAAATLKRGKNNHEDNEEAKSNSVRSEEYDDEDLDEDSFESQNLSDSSHKDQSGINLTHKPNKLQELTNNTKHSALGTGPLTKSFTYKPQNFINKIEPLGNKNNLEKHSTEAYDRYNSMKNTNKSDGLRSLVSLKPIHFKKVEYQR
jgi:hypothetical protein